MKILEEDGSGKDESSLSGLPVIFLSELDSSVICLDLDKFSTEDFTSSTEQHQLPLCRILTWLFLPDEDWLLKIKMILSSLLPMVDVVSDVFVASIWLRQGHVCWSSFL